MITTNRIICPGCGHENFVLVYSNKEMDQTYTCDNCFKDILKVEYYSGFVYYLSNKSMPGYIKIGCTGRDVYERVNELGRVTAVPVPFEIEAYFLSKNHAKDEQRVHQILSNFRVDNKEFFKIEIEKAVEKTREFLIDIHVRISNPKKPSKSPLIVYSQNCVLQRDVPKHVSGNSAKTISDQGALSDRPTTNRTTVKYLLEKELPPPQCFGQRNQIKNAREKGCLRCPHEVPCMRTV